MSSNISYDNWLDMPVYGMGQAEKNIFLSNYLQMLDKHHIAHCNYYAKWNNMWQGNAPALPVRLFKAYTLKSIQDKDVFKTLTSSGTTGQAVSKIFLDKETAMLQSRVLVKIMQSYIGTKRLPMLIIDIPDVVKDMKYFSARGAGILGMSNFGYKTAFALHNDYSLNYEVIEQFFHDFSDENILLFGFTFMIWQYFYKPILQAKKNINISKGVLIHSGGWKKLESEAVHNTVFKRKLGELFGIKRVHNFYGMVEQVGSIFVECEHGHLHAPVFADIRFINVFTGREAAIGKEGIAEVCSLLPRSYPGHRLLTEDMGKLLGEDNCPCGRKGKYFEITGRLPKAEVRGCSDTHTLEHD